MAADWALWAGVGAGRSARFERVLGLAARAFAVASENPSTKDLALDLELTFGMREPFFEMLGPTKPRGSANGLVIRKGCVVAEWGDTARSDMTFSVTKTFLSTTVGLAWQRGLIRDVADRVKDRVPHAGSRLAPAKRVDPLPPAHRGRGKSHSGVRPCNYSWSELREVGQRRSGQLKEYQE